LLEYPCGVRNNPYTSHGIPLLYFAYHIMVGLGTVMIAAMSAATIMLWRRMLYGARWMLWVLLLCVPFPYIANTAGWLTAEVGRQPWLVYGLLRTPQGYSSNVNAANSLFTLLGYMGLYLLLGILFIFIMQREIGHGPATEKLRSIQSETPTTRA
jgi:cytochrome d ubiquinol oxidase subunit I